VLRTLRKTRSIFGTQLLNESMSKINKIFVKRRSVAMAVDGRIFNEKDLIVTKLLILKLAEP